MPDASARFSPLIDDWFRGRYGVPTPIQTAAWPRILAGEHLVITAPTGSGKTLTAFLAAVNAFATGVYPQGQTGVLYVSPLKALNNDIRRNLETPLAELTKLARERGECFPEIAVATRSGDTSAGERQRMLRRPPEILITTPESLNLILSSPRARMLLATIRTVILDEIHAVIGTKRGTHLMTAVERMVLHAGEFQRIAVSATVRPLETVAGFVGGYRFSGADDGLGYQPRSVGIVEAPDTKRIELTVDCPDREAADDPDAHGFWAPLASELHRRIVANRSTLVFVTTRRHAEKITLMLNEGRDSPLAYAHHGSLSRELRLFVEEALKEGRLRAIVATSSLELGIDIGALDEVILVKTPPTVSSTLQQIGRAGHRVGETSRGILYPVYGRDMVDAAAMSIAVLARDIEETRPPEAPLDVLAQVIVSMTAMDEWDVDDLYDTIRTCASYRRLDRRLYDLVVEMLAGRYAEVRIRELRPRVSYDRVSGRIAAREGSAMLLYRSGGTIPDRGYYTMRMLGGGLVGELDEEFVWERRVGDTFLLGSQAWTIRQITERDVVVSSAHPGARAVPFWRAEAKGRDAHYALRRLDFLRVCEEAIARNALGSLLTEIGHLTSRMTAELTRFLLSQREATGCALPHRTHIVVECVLASPHQVIVHTGWGGKVNEPLALALAALWEREYGTPIELQADNDCLAATLPPGSSASHLFAADHCRKLLRRDALEALLRERLEGSARFGALFRENAGRALLLPRPGFSTRMPLWLNRVKSKKLLASTAALSDFPILIETWRSCLSEEFDLPALRAYLEEIDTGAIALSYCETTAASPFAADTVWRETNRLMYQDDSLSSQSRSSLSEELIRSVALTEDMRPLIPHSTVEQTTARLKRLEPGYAPGGPDELLDWITERIAVPADEVAALELAVGRDHGEEAWSIKGLEDRFLWIESTGEWFLATRNRLPSLRALYPSARVHEIAEPFSNPPRETEGREMDDAFGGNETSRPTAQEALLEMLRFFGPIPETDGARRFGIAANLWRDCIAELSDARLVVLGEISEGAETAEVCDVETLEYLLRTRRAAARGHFDPVESDALVPLFAATTMLAGSRGTPESLTEILDVLFGYPAPAGSWESDILPARLSAYHPVWLDGLFGEHDLVWLGCGSQKICFSLTDEIDLYRSFSQPEDGPAATAADLNSDPWAQAWEGSATTRTYRTVRRGIRSRFAVPTEDTDQQESTPAPPRWPGARGRRGRQRSAMRSHRRRTPHPLDEWQPLEPPEPRDPITAHEEDRERARTLIERYGVVFRELVDREGGAFSWGRIFRALRIMELAGECICGRFVRGVAAPQFAEPRSLEALKTAASTDRIVWMSAVDPASPCGLGLGDAFPDLPTRMPGSHLVFRGRSLIATSRRNGRDLTILVDVDDPDLDRCFDPLHNLVSRSWNPLPRVSVETINGIPARHSPFAAALRAAGFRYEHTRYVLEAPYR